MRRPIKRGRVMAEINITPFTDVVLVLLIIFMITTPMLVQPGIKIKLPKANAAETDSDKNITITINSLGEVFLENKHIDITLLKERLVAKLYNRQDMPVVVKGDKEVKYDTVIKIIDIAKQAGAKKFALAVEIQKDAAR
ncbi:MAG: biopolymer transporter ExbD [Elusimicrobia bacterium]|nr:biopolymer transporter ExbD [Elusimicrobiota bacterium]